MRVFAEDLRGYLKPSLEAELLHCVYSSLRESATTFAAESLKLVRGVTFDLLLLGTVLKHQETILHAFEQTPLSSNVEEEFGNRSSFESQRVCVQASTAELNSVLAQGEKD